MSASHVRAYRVVFGRTRLTRPIPNAAATTRTCSELATTTFARRISSTSSRGRRASSSATSRPGAARRTRAASRSRSSGASCPFAVPGEEEPDPQRRERRARGDRGGEALQPELREDAARDLDDGDVRARVALAGPEPVDGVDGVGRQVVLDAGVGQEAARRAVADGDRGPGPEQCDEPVAPAGGQPADAREPGRVDDRERARRQVGDVRRLDAHAADSAAQDARARQGVGAVEAGERLGRGREPVRAPEVDRSDLAADRPDDVPRLVAQQRAVGVDAAVEQRPHVGGERRRRDDLGLGDVALGDEQEEQVAEVVALVGADEQDPRRAAAAAERGERGHGLRRAGTDGHATHST